MQVGPGNEEVAQSRRDEDSIHDRIQGLYAWCACACACVSACVCVCVCV